MAHLKYANNGGKNAGAGASPYFRAAAGLPLVHKTVMTARGYPLVRDPLLSPLVEGVGLIGGVNYVRAPNTDYSAQLKARIVNDLLRTRPPGGGRRANGTYQRIMGKSSAGSWASSA